MTTTSGTTPIPISTNGHQNNCPECGGYLACPSCSPDSLNQLQKDLRRAAATLSPNEARFLVDAYYQMQSDRIRTAGQVRSMADEPHMLLDWLVGNSIKLESQIKSALDVYSESNELGRWARSIVGIGPVIAAGLLAHIDIEKAPTAGHIWRFAGLDPTVKWLGRKGADQILADVVDITGDPLGEDGFKIDPYALTESEIESYYELVTEPTGNKELNRRQLKAISVMTNRNLSNLLRLGRDSKGRITPDSMTKMLAKRPWNAALKVLCWKAGESFIKQQQHKDDIYGQVYIERRALEDDRNARGEFADQAAEILKAKKYNKATDAYKAYIQGYLPPAHLLARARRYAVKLFLAHFHHVAYMLRYGEEPPYPFILDNDPQHTHFIAPPNWPM